MSDDKRLIEWQKDKIATLDQDNRELRQICRHYHEMVGRLRDDIQAAAGVSTAADTR